jgi:hypothetical protein
MAQRQRNRGKWKNRAMSSSRSHAFGTLIDTELEPTDNAIRVELRARSHALAGKNGDLTAARSTQGKEARH